MDEDIINIIEDWRKTVNKLINQRNLKLPHISNLNTKLGLLDTKNDKWINAFQSLIPEYITFHEALFSEEVTEIESIVSAVNSYLNLLKRPEFNVFRHQSDFTSSVLPEFFCALFYQIISKTDKNYEVTGQGDIIIDCVFDAFDNGRMVLKRKRVDFAILLETELHFKRKRQSDFKIPILVMEIKTNLDKNMLTGIETTAHTLKRTFPNCLYFVISELADFDIKKLNYSASSIDEIYILRKQKRAAVRSGGDLQEVDVDLVKEITTRTSAHLIEKSGEVVSVKDRAKRGTLIGSRGAIDVTRGIEPEQRGETIWKSRTGVSGKIRKIRR